MARAKHKYRAYPFESVGEKFIDESGKTRKETSANLFESMLLSAAYKSLSDRQARLYTVCKAQFYGKRKPGYDYKESGLFQGDEFFYLNWATVQRYGVYPASSSKNFYRDMQALQDHGFIQKVASGKAHKKKNVYSFSDRWQAWQPP
ncbi:MAG: hypothetical protein K6B72_02445 [Lachnospiraceae bacterium]|nr:hypothetical protein [Lachnospiraceae bacterium]